MFVPTVNLLQLFVFVCV